MDNETFIRIYDSAIPQTLCDNLIKKFESNQDQWEHRDKQTTDRGNLTFNEVHCFKYMDTWEEDTKALADIDNTTLFGAVASAAIIEGGISYVLGTNPNARNAINALKGSVYDIASAITTQTWKRALQTLGKTIKVQVGIQLLSINQLQLILV